MESQYDAFTQEIEDLRAQVNKFQEETRSLFSIILPQKTFETMFPV